VTFIVKLIAEQYICPRIWTHSWSRAYQIDW